MCCGVKWIGDFIKWFFWFVDGIIVMGMQWFGVDELVGLIVSSEFIGCEMFVINVGGIGGWMV